MTFVPASCRLKVKVAVDQIASALQASDAVLDIVVHLYTRGREKGSYGSAGLRGYAQLLVIQMATDEWAVFGAAFGQSMEWLHAHVSGLRSMILNLHDKLTPTNWERALFAQRPYVAEGWSRHLNEEDLVIDLSRTGWIEPSAAVRAVLLAEGAVLSGFKVNVRLPRTQPTAAESDILRHGASSRDSVARKKAAHTSAYIGRRQQAARMLESMRLQEVLSHPHIRAAPGSLAIVPDYDWSIGDTGSPPTIRGDDGLPPSPSRAEGATPWYFKVVYGMAWVASPQTPEGRRHVELLSEVDVLADFLTHPSGRLAVADTRAMLYVFLNELVENTVEHAEREYALVIAWSRPTGIDLKRDEVAKCERDFAARIEGYPLLDISIGDSGRGIPATLRTEYRNYRAASPGGLINASEDENILLWSFDKWSSRKGMEKRRGTRGLYQVERLVRKYDGCITLRSETSYVGIDCLGKDPPAPISQSMARAPGTVAHVRLPVMLAEDPSGHVRAYEPGKTAFSVVDCSGLDWACKETANEVCKRVEARCRQEWRTRTASCVVVDLGFAVMQPDVLESLLGRLLETAHPVALAVANIKAPSWGYCEDIIRSLSTRVPAQETSAEHTGARYVCDPILVLHADDRSAWVAIPNEPNLASLWESGVLPSEQLAVLVPDQEKRSALIRQLKEAYHVIRRAPEGIALRFSAQDVNQCLQLLQDRLASEIQRAIEEGPAPGVIRSADLGENAIVWSPSLIPVSIFVNVDEFFHQPLGAVAPAAQERTSPMLDRATGVLAQKCGRIPRFWDPASCLAVVADWNTNPDVLESFRSNVQRILPSRIAVESLQTSPEHAPPIGESTNVIVFADKALSEDSVIPLVSQIARTGHVPVAVAALLDARPEAGRPLSALGQRIEVLSCAKLDSQTTLPARAGREYYISPISHAVEPEPSAGSEDYPIKDLAEMIQAEDALYFEHVVRPNGRHFCFYLDAIQLLTGDTGHTGEDLSPSGKRIIAAFLRAVRRWEAPGNRVDVIYYPHFPHTEKPSPAEIIAVKLGDGLLEQYGDPRYSVDLCAVGPAASARRRRRTPRTTQTELFEEGSRRELRTAIVVDWGCMTGKSLRELARFAASAGAERVLAVVFLSQLDPREEEFLVNLGMVPYKRPQESQNDCALSVQFLARYPIRPYSSLDCPHCRQLDRLDEEERFYPPPLLGRYMESARRRLRQRDLSGVRRERGGEISKKSQDRLRDEAHLERNVTEILSFRMQLEGAALSTRERRKLYEGLIGISEGVRSGDIRAGLRRACLIRLLAAEWTWLKQEPLSLLVFKKVIAEIAAGLVMEQASPEDERRDAIIVLRTASKDEFARCLPQLLANLVDSSELLKQLLYCVYTYLQREYLIPETQQAVLQNLERCREIVRGHPRISAESSAIAHTIDALCLQVELASHDLRDEPTVTKKVWRELSDWLQGYESHHLVADAIDHLYVGYLALSDIDWDSLRDEWSTVRKSVAWVIRSLGHLSSIFSRLTDARVLDPEEGGMLLRAGTEGERMVLDLTNQLDLFADFPAESQDERQRKKFEIARDWLANALLRTGRESGRRGFPLLTAFQDCPCSVRLAIAAVIGEPQKFEQPLEIIPTFEDDDDPVQVFCHKLVLMQCLRELLRNAAKNTESAVERKRIVAISVRLSEESVILEVRNDGQPVEQERLGRGLATYNRYVEAYGGSLEGDYIDDYPWFFMATVKLLRW